MALSSVPSIRLPPCLSGAARRTSIEAFPDVDEWDGLLLGDAEKMHDVALLDSSGCGSGYHFEDGWQHDRSVLRTVHHRILVGLVVLAATHISDTDRLAIFEDDGTDALNHIPGPPRGARPGLGCHRVHRGDVLRDPSRWPSASRFPPNAICSFRHARSQGYAPAVWSRPRRARRGSRGRGCVREVHRDASSWKHPSSPILPAVLLPFHAADHVTRRVGVEIVDLILLEGEFLDGMGMCRRGAAEPQGPPP